MAAGTLAMSGTPHVDVPVTQPPQPPQLQPQAERQGQKRQRQKLNGRAKKKPRTQLSLSEALEAKIQICAACQGLMSISGIGLVNGHEIHAGESLNYRWFRASSPNPILD